MSLTSWDREIAPYLRLIEGASKRVVSDGHDVKRAVAVLRSRPEFLTRAEDCLEQAEEKLLATLADIRAARASYATIPTERRPLVAAE